jgi:hypothetical protein
MIIVALGHETGVGKDTAGKFLQSALKLGTRGLSIRTDSTARPVKDLASIMYGGFGVKSADYYDDFPVEKDKIHPIIDKSTRDCWNSLTEFGNTEHPELWTNLLLYKHQKTDILILRDLRYTEHINIFKRHSKFFAIKIVRKTDRPLNRHDRFLENYNGWYKIIDNNGPMKLLNKAMENLAKEIVN